LSKSKKGQNKPTMITVRAICDQCKEVDEFHISTKDLLPHIGGLYQVSTIHHCKDDKEMVMNIVLDRNYAVRQATVSPFVGERETNRWSARRVADIKFLVETIKESDKVVRAVLSNRQVVVTGKNKTFVKRLIKTLELFSPRKYPSSIDWTEENAKDKKIIGTLPELGKKYKEAVIVNIDNNRISDTQSCSYCAHMLEYLIALDPEEMAYVARLKLDMLVDFSKMLIELSKEPGIGLKALELLQMDVSSQAFELIKEMASGFDPTALEIIREDWL
jgi:hypothetical protein